ncbi:MAG: translocation/assembly module TamB domain-containing protein [Dongiaceae bacterium]
MRRRWLLVALLVLLLPPAAAALFLATVDGAWLGRQASALLSTPDQRIEIGRIQGIARLRVDRVTLADRKGVWLEATGLAADWHPLALLHRRLAVDRLAAATVAYRRPPESDQPSQGGLPSLPLDLAVDRLAVDRLEAGPGAARLAGSLRVDRGWRNAAVSLDGTRLDAPGSASVRLEAPEGLDRFQLALHAEEPAGGLLASALDLPGKPPVRIALEGSGPASDWRGRLQAEATGLADLAGPVTVAGQRLGFDLAAHLGMRLPAPWASLAAGELHIAGAVRRDGERILLEPVKLDSAAASLTASGRVQPDLALRVQASLADLAPLAGLPGRAEADLQLSGSFAALAVEGGATLHDLVLPQLGRVAQADLALAGSLDSHGIRIAHAGIDSPLGQIFAEGSVSPTLALDVTAALPDLAPLAAAAGQQLAGHADLTAHLTGDETAQRLSGTIDAAGLALGQPVADRLLGGRLGGSFTVARAADGAIAIEAADLAAANVSVKGSGRLADGHAASDLTVTLPRLALLDPRLQGDAVVTLALQDRAGTMRAQGTVARQKLAAAARLALEAERLTVEDASLALGPTRLTGRAALQLASGLVDAELQVANAEPGPLLAGAAGRASGRITLAARPDGQAVSAELSGTGLAYAGLSVGQARLKLALADALRKPHGQASAELAGVAVGDTRIERASVALDGGLQGARVSLAASGEAAGQPVQIELAGNATPDAARIEKLTGRYGDLPVRLRQPLQLKRLADGGAVDGLDLAVGEATLSGGGRLAGGSVSGRLALANFKAALLQALAGTPPLRGTLQATATLDGTLARPHLALTAEGSDLGRADGPLHLAMQATGDWRDDRLAIKGTVTEKRSPPLAVEASLPLTYRAEPFAVALPPDGPIAGRVSGTLDLGAMLVAAGQDISASGKASIDLRVAGTLRAPQAAGTASLANGRYDDLTSGLSLRDIALEVAGDGQRFSVTKLSAGDGKGGTITGSGAVELAKAGLPFQAGITLNNLTVSPMGSAAQLDGKLALSGTVDAAKVEGSIKVDRADVTIPDRIPASVVQINVIEINGPPRPQAAGAPRPGTPEAPAPITVSLAIAIDMPGRVFVRGRGLESEWRGNLKVGGTADAPDLRGRLTLVRGNFDLLGKTFNLHDSTITFPGGDRIDPELALKATAPSSDLTATITVTGTGSRPVIELSSNPPLPQDEILAHVLFNRGVSQLSPTEAIQLAEGVQTLTGGTGPSGLLTQIRRATGLDTLGMTTDQTGNSALKVGKYVGDGLYVSAQQGTSTTSGRAGVTYQVTPHISVESSIGATGSPEVGVNWQWDY